METDSENQVFTRKQLYDLVWSKSLTQISQEYKCNYIQLKKICIENEIPIPENGHWSKLKFGKESKLKVLGPFSGIEKSIQLIEDKMILITKLNQLNSLAEGVKIAKNKTLVALYSGNKIHPDLIKTKEYYNKKNKQIYEGYSFEIPKDVISLHLPDEFKERAISILNLLYCSLLDRGFKVQINNNVITAFFEKIKLNFSMMEKRKRTLKTNPEYSWVKYDWSTVGIQLYYDDGSLNKYYISDSSTKKIEENFDRILEKLIKTLYNLNLYRIDLEEGWKIQEIEREERAVQEKLIKEDNDKFLDLVSNSESWHKAKITK